ncbi:uncharacterized protein LOC128870164 [Anastrepha ludens]|uniref:uncharacterized protein LOC128870164 n=1 Tax=Anastrepha ludens TaxID=28586 RepID=UPI0023AF55AC|nr:uncharacterized protein LOC128870164 [Anastrepha ludens]
MQKLRSKRALLKGAVTRICTFVNSNGIDQPIEDWECRLERLEEIWVDIVRVLIEKSDDEEGMHVEIKADWEEFEERMLCIKSKLRLHIAENSRVTAVTSATFKSTHQDAAVTTTSIGQLLINLRKIYDGADEVLRGLRALGEEAEKRDIWLIHLLLSKIDPATTREWAKLHKSKIDFPTINEFLSFLDTTSLALESAVLTTTSPTRQRIVSVKAHQTTVTRSMPCVKGNDTHELPQSSAFSRLDIKERRDFVVSKPICLNCLRVGHISANCRSKFSCRICRKRHHSLLHQDTIEASLQRERDEQAVTVNFNALPEINTLLPTVVCEVTDCNGEQQQCRMLLDSGSEKTIISENCVQRLGLRRQHSRIPIHGLNNIATGVSHGWVSLHITSMVDGESFNVEALIMPTISSSVPVQRLDKAQYSSFLSLDLADPTFYIPSPIDILLGSDKFFEILKGKKINNKSPNLKAFSTTLGWIVTLLAV